MAVWVGRWEGENRYAAAPAGAYASTVWVREGE